MQKSNYSAPDLRSLNWSKQNLNRKRDANTECGQPTIVINVKHSLNHHAKQEASALAVSVHSVLLMNRSQWR